MKKTSLGRGAASDGGAEYAFATRSNEPVVFALRGIDRDVQRRVDSYAFEMRGEGPPTRVVIEMNYEDSDDMVRQVLASRRVALGGGSAAGGGITRPRRETGGVYVVARDGQRPVRFSGDVLAHIVDYSEAGGVVHVGALYRTTGGLIGVHKETVGSREPYARCFVMNSVGKTVDRIGDTGSETDWSLPAGPDG